MNKGQKVLQTIDHQVYSITLQLVSVISKHYLKSDTKRISFSMILLISIQRQ